MECTLNCLKPGCGGIVTEICGCQGLQSRLRAFGLIPGTHIGIRYKSSGGGVAALELRSTVIALREGELGSIRVQVP